MEYMKFAVRWTRDDCKKLEEAGVLNYRYELIEGVIIRKMGQHLPHALTLSKADAWLKGKFGYDRVLSQPSVTVAPGETALTRPEPDVVLLNKPGGNIPADEPRPEDIALIIEVSDSTLDYDLQTKAAVYGRAGVPQYFVIDVNGREVYVHTNTPSGVYQRVTRKPGDVLTLLHAPHLALTVDYLLLPGV
jgi:Uma2 family endonuclease